MSIYNNLFLFDGLSEDIILEIEASLPKTKKFSKGDLIYSSECFSKSLAYIVSGTLIAQTDNNNCIVMQTFKEGMCFGAAALFGSGDRYVSSLTATADSEILFISEEQLENIFSEYPTVAINYIAFLSDRIRFLNKKFSIFSCQDAESSILKYLSASADAEGYADIPENMTLFAKMAGVGRATLYRCLDSLEAGGMIKRENNKIKVIENEKIN